MLRKGFSKITLLKRSKPNARAVTQRLMLCLWAAGNWQRYRGSALIALLGNVKVHGSCEMPQNIAFMLTVLRAVELKHVYQVPQVETFKFLEIEIKRQPERRYNCQYLS